MATSSSDVGGLLGTSRSALETELDFLSTNKDLFTRELKNGWRLSLKGVPVGLCEGVGLC